MCVDTCTYSPKPTFTSTYLARPRIVHKPDRLPAVEAHAITTTPWQCYNSLKMLLNSRANMCCDVNQLQHQLYALFHVTQRRKQAAVKSRCRPYNRLFNRFLFKKRKIHAHRIHFSPISTTKKGSQFSECYFVSLLHQSGVNYQISLVI